MTSDSIIDLINDLESPNDDIRLEAAQKLKRIKTVEAISALIKLLDDPDDEIYSIVYAAIRQQQNNPDIIPFIIPLLSHNESSIKNMAFNIIRMSDNMRIVEPLINMLDCNSSFNVCLIADTLGRIGDKKAIPALVKSLKESGNYLTSFCIYNNLAKLGYKELEKLEYCFETENWETKPEDYLSLLESLERPLRRLPESQQIKIKADIDKLKSPDLDERNKAIRRLGNRTGHVIEHLVEALASKNILIRYGALSALEKIRDPRTFPVIVKLLTDPSMDHKHIYSLLGIIDHERALEYLLDKIQNVDDYTAEADSLIFGFISIGRIAIPRIESILKTSDILHQVIYIRIIGRIRDISGIDVLTDFIYSPDPSIRKEAVNAIGSIGYKKPVEIRNKCRELISILPDDPDEDVRNEVDIQLNYQLI